MIVFLFLNGKIIIIKKKYYKQSDFYLFLEKNKQSYIIQCQNHNYRLVDLEL